MESDEITWAVNEVYYCSDDSYKSTHIRLFNAHHKHINTLDNARRKDKS